jgi:hypothetical protein
VDDASFCFQDVFCVHKEVYNEWNDPRCNTSGPNVTYIVEKALALFPRLHTITMELTVKFYDDLQSTWINYLLPLMPFDAICITFGFEALCPPGLGTGRYAYFSSTFNELLPRLLPVTTIPCISAIVDAMGMESNNGYDLLFCILVLTVPGFLNPTLPLSAPVWTSFTDLCEFCRSHHFYFHIQGKKSISLTITLSLASSSKSLDPLNMWTLLLCFNPISIFTAATTTMVASRITSALMILQRLSIHIQLLVLGTLATHVSTRHQRILLGLFKAMLLWLVVSTTHSNIAN